VIALLDSSAIIYWFEGTAVQKAAVRQEISQLKTMHPDAQIVVSRLGVMECCVKPLRTGNAALLAQYNTLFEKTKIVELTETVVTIATDLRVRYGLKTPDALQAASALSLGSHTAFITADAGFERVPHLNIAFVAG
jgi:predicted nucleic acid-binding protein